jgi:cell division protein FtsQ
LTGTGTTSTLEPPTRPMAEIDPRIRARRIEVRRGEGRRRLQRLVDLGMVLLVWLAFVAALWTPLLDVDEVRVEGAVHTGAAVVLERAGIQVGDRLVSVHLRAVGDRIADLPWIAEVELRRGVDGTVAIEVTERTAVVALGTGASALLVDRDGRVLGPVDEAPDAGPVVELTGIDPVPEPGSFLADDATDGLLVAERIAEAVPGALASLRLEELTGTLAQGGEVRFGDASQLEAKVRSLRTVLDQVDLRCLAVLDLRLPGSPVLTREEGCS